MPVIAVIQKGIDNNKTWIFFFSREETWSFLSCDGQSSNS